MLYTLLQWRSHQLCACMCILYLDFFFFTNAKDNYLSPFIYNTLQKDSNTVDDNSNIPNNNEIFDIVIIGSGIAGLSSAIYAGRLGRGKQLVLSGDDNLVGGELLISNAIDNYPGFPDPLSGFELGKRLEKQATQFGAHVARHSVNELDLTSTPFQIQTSQELKVFAKAIILATGATANWLDVDGEALLKGEYIHTCALCDGVMYTDQTVVVIGGGDAAMESAAYLSRIAKTVYIIHRRDTWRASETLIEQVKQLENVKFKKPFIVKRWMTDTIKLTGVVIKYNHPGSSKHGRVAKIQCDGAFLNIGSSPKIKFLQDQIDLDTKGFAILKKNSMTSVPGVFAAGQVADWRYKQAITAADMGARAAIDADRWLREKGEMGKLSEEQISSWNERGKSGLDTFTKKEPKKLLKEVSYTVRNGEIVENVVVKKQYNDGRNKLGREKRFLTDKNVMNTQKGENMPLANKDMTNEGGDKKVSLAYKNNKVGFDCDKTQRECLHRIVQTHDVVMFERRGCPACKKAKYHLRQEGIEPYSVLNDGSIQHQKMAKTLYDMTGKRSVPIIFINSFHFPYVIDKARKNGKLQNALKQLPRERNEL